MRRRLKLVVLSTLVALFLWMLPGVAFANFPVSVKIAVAGPLGTAGAVSYGQGMERGVQLAVNDRAGDLTAAGVSVAVAPWDDQEDPLIAVDNATEIVADPQVMGVVGHVNSGCSIPASTVYANSNLTMITPWSTNPWLTEYGNNNVFRTCGTDSGQGPFAADRAIHRLRRKTAFIVNDSTPYGRILANGFSRRFKTDKGKVVGYANTADNQKNFSRLVKQIKRRNPKVVYYGGIYTAGGRLAKQLKAKGVKAVFMGADGIHDPSFVRIAGRRVANGDVATDVGIPTSWMPGGPDFSQRYVALFGFSPGIIDAYAYDAANTLINAIIAVANNDGNSALTAGNGPELVREQVSQSNFAGVTGQVAFNSTGDTEYPAFSTWHVVSGTWRAWR